MKRCDDCGRRLWFRRCDIIAVDGGGVEVSRTLACPHCAEVWELLVKVSEQLGPESVVSLLKEMMLDNSK